MLSNLLVMSLQVNNLPTGRSTGMMGGCHCYKKHSDEYRGKEVAAEGVTVRGENLVSDSWREKEPLSLRMWHIIAQDTLSECRYGDLGGQ